MLETGQLRATETARPLRRRTLFAYSLTELPVVMAATPIALHKMTPFFGPNVAEEK